MATIDQGGNSFGTSMNIGTTDPEDVKIMTNGSTKMTIGNSGQVGVGVTTPTPFNASAALFPSLIPKVEILTGTAWTAYNEGLVIRHNGHDVNAVSRNVGVIFKLSNEVDSGGIVKSWCNNVGFIRKLC